jgi:prepilin-type N-terminal cleavage/methylation domain-containing protein
MRQKSFGFTLIELLIVIVIIGALSTVATATFKSYFTKARDAERASTNKSISMMVKVDGASEWTDAKYVYSVAGLEYVLKSNDYQPSKSKHNICSILGTAQGGNTYLGNDNEFVFMTWGEQTSTWDKDTPGVIVTGTDRAIENVLMADLDIDDFACDKSTVLAEMAFETDLSGLISYYLGIDEEGDVFQWGGGNGGADCLDTTKNNCDLNLTVSGDNDGNCESEYTGSCDYHCDDGTWILVTNDCTEEVPANCGATTQSNCDLVETASGGTDGDCEDGYIGDCLYSCSDGAWSLVSNTCVLPAPDPPVDCASFGLFQCWWNWADCRWNWWWGPCENR